MTGTTTQIILANDNLVYLNIELMSEMDKYKDPPEIIAEMLIKQDQMIGAIEKTNEKIDKTNNILENFMEISTKQWGQQMIFNERFYNKLEKFENTF